MRRKEPCGAFALIWREAWEAKHLGLGNCGEKEWLTLLPQTRQFCDDRFITSYIGDDDIRVNGYGTNATPSAPKLYTAQYPACGGASFPLRSSSSL